MDIRQYLAVKLAWAESNAEDQSYRDDKVNQAFWLGRAQSFKDLLNGVRDGIHTVNGLDTLTLPKA